MWRSSQFAVPVFFMTSGFYAYQAAGESFQSTIKRRLLRIINITLFAVAFYALYKISAMLVKHEMTVDFSMRKFFITTARIILLCDFRFLAAHLWFLMALIETYILLLLVDRFNLWKILYSFIPISFIVSGLLFTFFNEDWILRANVFCSGMCWVSTGYYIAANVEKFQKISGKKIFFAAFAGWLLGLLCLFDKLLFISSLGMDLFSVSLFIWAVKNENNSRFLSKFPFIVKIGSEYSLYVYLFHFIVSSRVHSIFRHLGFSMTGILLWLWPILVCFFSVIASMVIVKAQKIFMGLKNGA